MLEKPSASNSPYPAYTIGFMRMTSHIKNQNYNPKACLLRLNNSLWRTTKKLKLMQRLTRSQCCLWMLFIRRNRPKLRLKKKKEKPIETTAARKRINLVGAINLSTFFFIKEQFETINGASIIEFLKKIENAYPDAKQIHLFMDRAGYNTCVEVKTHLATSRIRVYFLPPRSPNLNPIERLWKLMHEYVSHNKVYENFQAFRKALFKFFDETMPNITDVVLSRITNNFQIIYP